MSTLVTFEDKNLAIHTFRGKPCIIAKELGELLGYTVEGFQRTLKNWDDELIQGVDIDVLRGDELREFRDVLEGTAKMAVASASQLTVLFESGFDLVLVKTEKPAGRALRRLLVTEVLPKLRRGEAIVPQSVAPAAYRPEVDELERARAVRLMNLPAVSAALKAIVSDGWFDERFAKDFIHREIQDATGRLLPAANQYPVNLEIFLQGKGASDAEARRLACAFGKMVKAKFVELHGEPPPSKQEPGRAYIQASYYTEDLGVIEEAFALFAPRHPSVFSSMSKRGAA